MIIYCDLINDTVETPLIIIFFLMTYFGAKKYQKKS